MITINQIKFFSKLKQRKFRLLYQKFLIEGEHLIEECLKSESFKGKLEIALINSGYKNESFLEKLSKRNINIEILEVNQFKKISETENPQGIIGVVNFSESQKKQFPQGIAIALENINDPGNLGTILRTSWWFNVKDILISKNSVDVFNSKTIRASQGAIFNLNIQSEIDLQNYLSSALKKNYDIYLTTIASDNLLTNFKYNKNKNTIIVFGNEANGISKELKSIPLVKNLSIQGYSNCESLNISQSVAIFLYHFKSVN